MQDEQSRPPHPLLPAYYRSMAEREAFVRGIFDGTARYYDRINAIFSLGTGRWYRRQTLRAAGLAPGQRVLDIATGTGLVAREAASIAGAGRVVGLDVSAGMLAECRRAMGRRAADVALVQADAQRPPFADETMDFLSMGYALRHVRDLDATFSAFHALLRPGGRLLILEIGRASSPIAQALLKLYLGRVVPLLSGVAASRDSRTLMAYYWDTINECVPPASILESLRKAGFADVRKRTEFGVFHAYMATRAPRAAA
jgi:demethylmenaquinone methyltransferase/2-methoxy-6-polyprenyl-1,4-benzoquinol methylase